MSAQIKDFNYLKLISILAASIVPFLVWGPFIPDLILSCLSIWFLFFSVKNKIYNYYQNKYFFLFISFCFVCILSSLFSDKIIFSLKSSLFYFRIGIFAILISYLISKYEKILDYFYISIFCTFFVLILDGFLQYFTGTNILNQELHTYDNIKRVSSLFGEELILGSFLSRLSPLFFALFFIKKNKKNWEICLIIILYFLIFILILMSGERASLFFYLILSFFLFSFTLNKFQKIMYLMLILSMLIIIFKNNDSIYERFINDPLKKSGLTQEGEKFIFTKNHDSLIKIGWRMFLDKPVLGHGPKMFRFKCKEYQNNNNIYCDVHPHNFYIQLLAETGFVGVFYLIFIFLFCIFLFFKYLKNKKLKENFFLTRYHACLLAGLVITLWPLTSNGNFFTNNLMILYSLQIGFFQKN